MLVRTALALGGMPLFAVPLATAAAGEPGASGSGGVHWTIELPNPFGIEVGNQPLAFNARKYADGTVWGSSSTTRSPWASRSTSTST